MDNENEISEIDVVVSIDDVAVEHNLYDSIDSNRFFEILRKKFNYDYKTLSRYIDGENYSDNEQQLFNITIRTLKSEYGIHIKDSILFLEETMPLNNIISVLDDDTMINLRSELSEVFHIQDDSIIKTKLSKFYKK